MLYTAFAGYLINFSCWFVPKHNARASLQTSRPGWRAGMVTENRLIHVKRLGALCALMLIAGICPEPLNPLLLHFVIHGFDFNSLTPGIVQEWHPELYQTITDWLETGPSGDTEPFRSHWISYHDQDVSVYYQRMSHSINILLAFSIAKS